jgi:hypothetical protein
MAAAPRPVIEKSLALASAPGAVTPAVLYLSLGAMEMKLTRIIAVGATLLAAGILTLSLGPALLPWANAQDSPRGQDPKKPDQAIAPATPAKPSSEWEYSYHQAPQPLSETGFEAACRNMEAEGWEYCGTQEMTFEKLPMAKGATRRGPELVLVFKRPTAARAAGQRERAEVADRIATYERSMIAQADRAKVAEKRQPDGPNAQIKSADPKSPVAAFDRIGTKQPADSVADIAKDYQRMAQFDRVMRETEDMKKKADASEREALSAYLRQKKADDELAGDVRGAIAKKPAGETITIIPLAEGNAEKVAKMLTELFSKQGTFQSDDRSNSLVIKADAKTLNEVVSLLDRLEQQAASRKAREKIDPRHDERPKGKN